MFKRLNLPEWQDILAILAFAATFLLFLVIVIRAIRMRRDKVRHMANLPLENDETSDHDGPEKKTK